MFSLCHLKDDNLNELPIGTKILLKDGIVELKTIEKTKDGVNFEQVKVVDGAGNSTSVINYSAVDNNPFSGNSYYRLKQTDFDGNFTFSSLQSMTLSSGSFSFSSAI